MDINPVTTPEFFSPESRTDLVAPVVAVLMVIGAAIVGLRFYTRAMILHFIGPDDWLALAALLLFFALGIGTVIMAEQGLGRHIGTLPQPDGFKDFMRTFWVTIILYNLTILSVRLSFLAQYYRIMALKKMRIIVLAVAGLVTAWSFSQLMLSVFQCTPVSGFWDRTPDTKCLTSTTGWYLNAAGNIVSDILVLILPLPMIKGLNLPRNQKVALAGVFCLGFFTCAISVIRIQFLMVSIDVSFDTVDAQFWSIGEVCSGIVCAALPTLRPLVGKWLPRLLGSARSTSSYRMGSGWRPKDVESAAGARSRGTRRGTKQFASASVGTGDEELMVAPRDHEAGGTAYLELSDSIELQERPNPNPSNAGNDHNDKQQGDDEYNERGRPSLSYPAAVYAGPVPKHSGRSVEILGGEASKTGRTREEKDLLIRIKHDIVINHGK